MLQLFKSVRELQLAGVVPLPPEAPSIPVPMQTLPPSILIDASTGRGPGSLAPGRLILALSRGVLYALNRSDGKVLWAKRVGIDTTSLPERLPALAGNPERMLVFNSDAQTLSALDEQGRELWRYALRQPCVGRPLVIGQRAFLPTADGVVHEIELHEGHSLGRYPLGQRLTQGGVRPHPKSPLLYFPADHSCVYALNTETKKCDAILYSDHPAGSLRSEPLILGSNNAAGVDGWLVLNQARGLDAVQLRIFELPIRNGATGELTLNQPAVVPGWTWFPPTHDSEKLALLSDTGMLGLFGIRQEHNRDAPLFPWLPGGSGSVNLEALLHLPTKARGRAEVEICKSRAMIWRVLANGELQRLRLELGGKQGLTIHPVWNAAVALGSPRCIRRPGRRAECGHRLRHDFSHDAGETRRKLPLPPLSTTKPARFTGKRQLGLVCNGEPLLLHAPDDKGPPLLLALDQSGALFAFDPLLIDPKPGELKESHGRRLAPALEPNPHVTPLLLRGDGESAFEIACPGDGRELIVRHALTVGENRRLQCRKRIKLEANLFGTPGLSASQLILPLANGNLYRLLWKQADKPLEMIDEWRLDAGSSDAQGHVASLGKERFLCTYGSHGLSVYQSGEKSRRMPSPLRRPIRRRSISKIA